MTPEQKKRIEEAAKNLLNTKTKSGWMFVNTGQLHGLWKRKKYSEIMEYAKTLPPLAWDAGREEGIKLEREMAQVLVGALKSIEFCPRSISGNVVFDMQQTAKQALAKWRELG